MVQLSQPYMTTGKTLWIFVSKVMSLLFNMLFFLISFSSKEQGPFNFMAVVTVCSDFEAQENKVSHCFHCFPSVCHEVMGLEAMVLVLWMLSFKPAFSLSSFSIRGSLVSLPFVPLEWYHLPIWGCWYFSQQSWFQLVLHPAPHFTWCTLCVS